LEKLTKAYEEATSKTLQTPNLLTWYLNNTDFGELESLLAFSIGDIDSKSNSTNTLVYI
jgi:hypothetical protein